MGGYTGTTILFAQAEHMHVFSVFDGVPNALPSLPWCYSTEFVHANLAKGPVVHNFASHVWVVLLALQLTHTC